jgi:hypothetical protein
MHFEIRAPDEIDRLIALTANMNLVGRIELLRAIRAGVLNMVELDREGKLPVRAMEKSARPVLVLIGDDDYAATGPTGWAATRRLLYWAKAGLVHATAADAASYRMAMRMTSAHRRVALIETDTAHAAQWSTALVARRIPCIELMPGDGGTHPIPLARNALQ